LTINETLVQQGFHWIEKRFQQDQTGLQKQNHIVKALKSLAHPHIAT
jgi:hypothetical protein